MNTENDSKYDKPGKEAHDRNDKSKDSTHPDHKKDTQSGQSKDPTRKNEAHQGASDLRTRTKTHFRREGEGSPESE